MCIVALNRPPTESRDHINPPDVSEDGNKNVYLRPRIKKKKKRPIKLLVKESGLELTCCWVSRNMDEKIPLSRSSALTGFQVVSLIRGSSFGPLYVLISVVFVFLSKRFTRRLRQFPLPV